MSKLKLFPALALCAACAHDSGSPPASPAGRGPDDRQTVEPDSQKPTQITPAGEQAQPQALELSDSFRLSPEFGGCGITRDEETEDLSELGIDKAKLSVLFGTRTVVAHDHAGNAENLTLVSTWTGSSARLIETERLPSDDEFAATCPARTVALAMELSLSSAITGPLSASGFLFTKDGSTAAGTLRYRSDAGKTYLLHTKTTASGVTTGAVIETDTIESGGGSTRLMNTVLKW